FLSLPVDVGSRAQAKLKMMSLGVSPEVDFMGGGVQGAGSDLMVQGLPDVGQLRVDQQHAGALALPQSVSQSASQFQTTRTAAANDDRMQRITHVESPLEKNRREKQIPSARFGYSCFSTLSEPFPLGAGPVYLWG